MTPVAFLGGLTVATFAYGLIRSAYRSASRHREWIKGIGFIDPLPGGLSPRHREVRQQHAANQHAPLGRTITKVRAVDQFHTQPDRIVTEVK